MTGKKLYSVQPLAGRFPQAVRGRCLNWLLAGIDRWSGLDEVCDIHSRARRLRDSRLPDAPNAPFVDDVMEAMEVGAQVVRADFDRIPKKGPLVVVANHPYGGLEGIVLASVLGKVRPDVKVMANYLLSGIPEMQEMFIAVDPFGGPDSQRTNAAGLRAAMRHLKSGGCLVMFPAGEVAAFSWKKRRVSDRQWQLGAASLIRRSGAAALPVFVPGGNGMLFHAAGMLHPRLRTVLLPSATVGRQHTTLKLRLGSPISSRRLGELSGDAELTHYLRQRVHVLRHRTEVVPNAAISTTPAGLPVVDAVPAAVLAQEVASLPPSALLVGSESDGDYVAYIAAAPAIPNVLREIGRLREITFRSVGEGTGKSIDLDTYDQHYLHLFIWNHKANCVVGAYRLGLVNEILATRGKSGLYTTTLFDFPASLLSNFGGAIEMGRSFVRAEYQRSHQPLLLLWKGIGTFCVRNPEYHTLFGPVSISAAYATVSRQLMHLFLQLSGTRSPDAALVRARVPFRRQRYAELDAASLTNLARNSDDVADLVSDMEPDAKGLPVLLQQYLKLGARVLSFNVDPDFGGCLDALITVDLRRTDRKLLQRYMGKAGLAHFVAVHSLNAVAGVAT